MECPNCRHQNPGGARFCNHCGTPLAVICSACRQQNAPDARFCSSCGTGLAIQDVAATTAVAAEPATSEPKPPPIPTSFVGGRYEVRRFLGEGGKKKVYLVHDSLLDRDVAFSLIKTQGLDETGVERIRREAQVMGRLGGHPYIVSVYDMGDEAGQPYLVSELMGGGDVEGLIEKAPEHRPALTETLRIAEQICQALEYAHERGIIHRDLKPGNVWLTKDGTAKLGDFGLAMSVDRTRLSIAGMIVGTVSYMPPEQALGRTPDARADLYSLGAMLYEMVTGRPPFLGDDPVAIISQHVNALPVAPSWHNPQVPKPLETLILRLLAKDPSERPADAADVRRQVATIAATATAPTSTEQLQAQEHANVLDQLAGGVFVGRDREMERLRQAFDESLSGRGQMVLLSGEPGIGKTRLAEELSTYAQLRGAQVLWGRAYEWGGAPAYWPWIQMIRDYVHDRDPETLRSELGSNAPIVSQIVSEVRERLPGLAEAPVLEGEQGRFRLFDALTTFLRTASTRQPLLLVFDDLHWADEPSLLLLQFVARELGTARLIVVGTYRDVEVGRHHPLARTLAELARMPRTQRVGLRGLTADEVARYLELTAGSTVDRRVSTAVYKETDGNPFFVTEVVRLLATEDRLEPVRDETWSVDLPQGVREVVGRRLDRLSETANEVLGVAAVIGREFSLPVLERVTGLSTDDVLDALDEATAARIVEEGQGRDRYRFSQELVQEILYEELSIARRRRLNGAIGEALERLHAGDRAADYAELAHHFSLAGSEHAAKAIDYAVKAGVRAMSQFAWESAIRHFELALQNLELQVRPDPVQHCEVLLALGEAQNRSAMGRPRGGEGRYGAGASPVGRDTFCRAAEVARSAELAEHMARAALGVVGFNPHARQAGIAGVELVEEALRHLPGGDSALRVRLLARLGVDPYMLAFGELITNTPDLVAQLCSRSNEVIAMARRLGDSSTLAYALVMRGLQYELHPHEERLANANEIVSIAEAANNQQMTAWGHYLQQMVFMEQGKMAAAHESLERFEAVATQLQLPFFLWVVAISHAAEALNAGQFADAEQWIERAHSIQPGSGAGTTQRIMVHRHRGNLENLFNEFPDKWRRGALYRSLWVASLADTRPEDARRELQGSIVDDVINAPLLLRGMSWLAETYYALGDAAHAQVLYEHLLPYAEYNAITTATDFAGGSVSYYLGLLAATMSRWDDAERHFEDALRMNEERGIRPYAAYTRHAYAKMLVQRDGPGDREQALDLVDQALNAAEAMGMAHLAEQALALKVRGQGILKA